MRTTYTARFRGADHSVMADWGDPRSTVAFGEGGVAWYSAATVAKLGGSPHEAMRRRVQLIAEFEGLDPGDPDVSLEIENSLLELRIS